MLLKLHHHHHSFIHSATTFAVSGTVRDSVNAEGFHWGLITCERERERGTTSRSETSGGFACILLGFLLPWASLDTCFLNWSSAPQPSKIWVRRQWTLGQMWLHLYFGPARSLWGQGSGEKHWPSGNVLNELIYMQVFLVLKCQSLHSYRQKAESAFSWKGDCVKKSASSKGKENVKTQKWN